MVKIAHGVKLREGKTDEAEVVPIPGTKHKELGIVIHEGRNRQIHRMFEAVGYVVVKLDRVAYAEITYSGLPRGRWRYLTRSEVRQLEKTIGIRAEEIEE
jgi:23S rRNA pseudouridine2605 synthase